MKPEEVNNRKDAMIYLLLQLNEKNNQIELGEAFFSSGYSGGIESFEGLMNEMDAEGLIKKTETPSGSVPGMPWLKTNKVTYEISFKGVEYLAENGKIEDSTKSLKEQGKGSTTIHSQNLIYNEGSVTGDQIQNNGSNIKKQPENSISINPNFDPIIQLLNVFDKFHIITRQLRNRYDSRSTLNVSDEYDVQDLLHSLLHLYFEDIRPEEWTPSYAGKSSRMDFLLKDYKTVIEVKRTRTGLTTKELGSQLIDDIARYQAHPDCESLICFTYDPEGLIGNPRGLEKDLSREEGSLKVKVIVRP